MMPWDKVVLLIAAVMTFLLWLFIGGIFLNKQLDEELAKERADTTQVEWRYEHGPSTDR